jgi:hypothetical protein
MQEKWSMGYCDFTVLFIDIFVPGMYLIPLEE